MNKALKNKILESLENIKAVNPIAIDVKKISSLTDFMVIASGTSNRHLAAMSDKVIEGLEEILESSNEYLTTVINKSKNEEEQLSDNLDAKLQKK